jgi:ComF family protein
LGDVFFPPVCVHCRGLVEDSGYRHLCARCAGRLDFVRSPCCATCGHPFYGPGAGEAAAAGGCEHCAELFPAFRRGRAAVMFRGPARALVMELKYHRGRHVLEDIEAIFRRSAGMLAHVRGAALVPVPLHPRKRRERGYNQSELVARALARAAGGGTRVERLLRRVVDTPTQTGFDRPTRRSNLKNAFALARGAGLNPRRRYVLVDDVFTTGSTLNSCARELRRAGCLKLDVAMFGHG